jgi:hypothetical protein
MRSILKALIWLDRAINVLLGGEWDETLSGRAWRMKVKNQPYWFWCADFIDALFFWQVDHCRVQHEAEYAASLVKGARI